MLAHGLVLSADASDGEVVALAPVAFAAAAYVEHERVWNGFREKCHPQQSSWFDGALNCTAKVGVEAFLDAFHALLLSMRSHGYAYDAASSDDRSTSNRSSRSASRFDSAKPMASYSTSPA